MPSTTLSRNALYDLVWSQPVRALAPTFDLSDVGLRKVCARTHIPLRTRTLDKASGGKVPRADTGTGRGNGPSITCRSVCEVRPDLNDKPIKIALGPLHGRRPIHALAKAG